MKNETLPYKTEVSPPQPAFMSSPCTVCYAVHALSRGETAGGFVGTWSAVGEGLDRTVGKCLTSDTVAFRCTQ